MPKYGTAISIDVKAIDKARLVNHTNGKTYLNMTVFIDSDNPDQYGQHGMITQDVSKEERDQGVKGNILGNAKVFWNEQGQAQNLSQPQQRQQSPQQAPNNNFDEFDSDIGF